ncbi:MAG TPA: hypothetical protein VM261_22610 [Kofleriaceae bacterium]|nr:hypothetical protein [Kofleriaceae bacterium]
MTPFLVAVTVACSSKAPAPRVKADSRVAVADAAAALPAIEWQDDGTLAVDGTWRVDPETWRWTAIGDGREMMGTKTTYPETPPAASATAIREASGKWSAWSEAKRICFIDMPVPGYVCAEIPTTH